MNNQVFLSVLKSSFIKFLETGSRSNEKLKILHGKIAEDIHLRLNNQNITECEYNLFSLGFGQGREQKIPGRYLEKTADITVFKSRGRCVGGLAVKFVMSKESLRNPT